MDHVSNSVPRRRGTGKGQILTELPSRTWTSCSRQICPIKSRIRSVIPSLIFLEMGISTNPDETNTVTAEQRERCGHGRARYFKVTGLGDESGLSDEWMDGRMHRRTHRTVENDECDNAAARLLLPAKTSHNFLTLTTPLFYPLLHLHSSNPQSTMFFFNKD